MRIRALDMAIRLCNDVLPCGGGSSPLRWVSLVLNLLDFDNLLRWVRELGNLLPLLVCFELCADRREKLVQVVNQSGFEQLRCELEELLGMSHKILVRVRTISAM